jgi:FkbM family methyltransferase
LAKNFARVITFEPDHDNFACLEKNTAGYPNITRYRAAVGEIPRWIATTPHQNGNCGAVYVTEGESSPLVRIDDRSNPHDGCDLIWLDVEGYEEPALRGAARTIDEFHPAIIIEEKSHYADAPLAEMHGLEPYGAVKWLKERQYHRVVRHNNDCLWVYGGA